MSGCRSALCADMCETVALCRRIFVDTRSILLPVLLSIGLTQAVWVGIYDCKVTRHIFPNSTGSITEDITNAAMAMAVIALVSALMITLAILHFKKTVKSWLALSCAVCSFVIAGAIFQDGAARLPVDETVQLAIGGTATAVYGGGAVLAFFTKHLPASAHQLYVVSVRRKRPRHKLTEFYGHRNRIVIFARFPITNCSAIATFYLTCLHGNMAWFLLAAVVLWDIFAVLAPIGPLKLALERSQDYGADVLRFMMFTAESEETSLSSKEEEPTTVAAPGDAAGDAVADDDEDVVFARPVRRLAAGRDQLRQDRDTSSSSSDSASSSEEDSGITSSGSSQSASGDAASETDEVMEKNEKEEEGLNAREALNTGSHLGFGDFIFYSILVGSSMAVGVLPALSSTLGVLVGLAYTLSIPSEQETLPALPISIIFGMTGHFYTRAQMAVIGYTFDYLIV